MKKIKAMVAFGIASLLLVAALPIVNTAAIQENDGDDLIADDGKLKYLENLPISGAETATGTGPDMEIIFHKGLNVYGFTLKNTGTVTLKVRGFEMGAQPWIGISDHASVEFPFPIPIEPGESQRFSRPMWAFGLGTFGASVSTDKISGMKTTLAFFIGALAYYFYW